MPRQRKIAATLINAAIFIAMEVAALNMLAGQSNIRHLLIGRLAHGFQARVWGGFESARYYFSLRKANEDLSRENFLLSQRLRELGYEEELSRMDDLARRMSGGAQAGGFVYRRGSIVKISRNKQHNYLILGQGYEDGVEPRSGIVTACGVVGIVDQVSRHYSYAISFMNSELSVSARLGRDGAVGPLVWDGKSSDGAVLREIPLQYKFAPGDTVFTSGYSSIFPSDIPLGLVREAKVVNGATWDISIRLLQDYGAIRYVTIVSNSGREEIEELQQTGGGL